MRVGDETGARRTDCNVGLGWPVSIFFAPFFLKKKGKDKQEGDFLWETRKNEAL